MTTPLWEKKSERLIVMVEPSLKDFVQAKAGNESYAGYVRDLIRKDMDANQNQTLAIEP